MSWEVLSVFYFWKFVQDSFLDVEHLTVRAWSFFVEGFFKLSSISLIGYANFVASMSVLTVIFKASIHFI